MISFKIVTLCSNTLVPAFLPLLKSGLEVVFCKWVFCNLLWILTIVLKGWHLSCISSLEKNRSLQVVNLTNGVGAETIQYCFWLETHEWGKLGDRAHCHCEEYNPFCSIDLVAFIKCPPSNTWKLCSRTFNLWSGPGRQILDAQYHRQKKKKTLSKFLIELQLWRALPLCQLWLQLSVIPINPTSVTGDDPWHEDINSGILTKILTDSNMMFFLQCSWGGG